MHDGSGVGLGDGDGLGDGVGEGLGDGVGVGDGDGPGVGVGDGAGAGASSVTTKALPAIVTVAERGPAVVFRSTVIVTDPLPDPLVVSR